MRATYSLPLYSVDDKHQQVFSSYHMGHGRYELYIWTYKHSDILDRNEWYSASVGYTTGNKSTMQDAIDSLRKDTGYKIPYLAEATPLDNLKQYSEEQ